MARNAHAIRIAVIFLEYFFYVTTQMHGILRIVLDRYANGVILEIKQYQWDSTKQNKIMRLCYH